MSKSFSLFLLKNGVINRQQLIESLKLQKNEVATFERVAVEHGILSAEQAKKIADLVRKGTTSFKALALEQGYVTQEKCQRIETLQAKSPEYLCEAIARLEYLPQEKIKEELEKYHDELSAPEEGDEMEETSCPSWDEDTLHEKLMTFLVESARKNFAKLATISLEFSPFYIEKKSIDNLGNIVFLEIKGDLDLMAFLSLNESLTKSITNNMIKYFDILDSIDPESMNLVSSDCIGEFFNIICGQWQTTMSLIGKNLKISTPRVEGIGGQSRVIFAQGNKAVYARLRAREGRGFVGYIEMAKNKHE